MSNGYFQNPCRKRISTRQTDLDGGDFSLSVVAAPGENSNLRLHPHLKPKVNFGDVEGFVTAGDATLFDAVNSETPAGTVAGPNNTGVPAPPVGILCRRGTNGRQREQHLAVGAGQRGNHGQRRPNLHYPLVEQNFPKSAVKPCLAAPIKNRAFVWPEKPSFRLYLSGMTTTVVQVGRTGFCMVFQKTAIGFFYAIRGAHGRLEYGTGSTTHLYLNATNAQITAYLISHDIVLSDSDTICVVVQLKNCQNEYAVNKICLRQKWWKKPVLANSPRPSIRAKQVTRPRRPSDTRPMADSWFFSNGLMNPEGEDFSRSPLESSDNLARKRSMKVAMPP